MNNYKGLAALLRETKQIYDQVPFWKHLGLEVESVSEKSAVLSLKVNPGIHMNSQGMVHGGVYASLLDNVMALSTKSVNLLPMVTTHMSVEFLASASEGTIKAFGKLIHQTKSTFTTQGEVKDQDGNLLAYATANFLIVKKPAMS